MLGVFVFDPETFQKSPLGWYMKICLIAPIPPFRGGVAKYSYSLAQELEKRHELLLLSYSRQYPAFLYGRKPQKSAVCDTGQTVDQFNRLSYDVDSLNPATWQEVVRRVISFAPDVVILPWWVTYWTPQYAWLLSRFRKSGIKSLLLCINVYDHEDSALKKLLTRCIVRRADLLLVHSEMERTELRRIAPATVIRKELLPIFSYTASLAKNIAGPLNLLFFGFVRPYKGLDLLLRALCLVRDIDVQLNVVGEFWDGKQEALQLIGELDIASRVTVVDGYVTDEEMAGCFARADVVVLPYRASKTSGVIATSYGFGKPVLATDVGGFYEVVKDGVTGRLVPPNDVQAIADGIRWFYINRQVDFGGNIASFVERQMSWKSLVDVVEEMVLS